jgi:hypothetical protein
MANTSPILETLGVKDESSSMVATPGLSAARRVFYGTALFTVVLTLVWLFFVLNGRTGGFFFGQYRLDGETIGRVVIGFLVFWVGWGWLWYRLKRYLLRKAAGLSSEEIKTVLTSRMRGEFDLSGLLARHSERRIRIVDMVGRRGRAIPAVLSMFFYLYIRIAEEPSPKFLTLGLTDNLFDAIVYNWVALTAYYSSGFLGRVVYGAQARIMDGVPGRANALLIGTLWSAFKFVLVPIGIQLAAHFPPNTYAALFVFIWISYVVSDSLSEIIGSLIGKQRLRVWGIGEVNRKSVAGTWACFLGSLVVCLWVVWANGLPAPWLGLALVISVANTAVELFSPRGTDDFTMATTNALLCWAFGVIMY